VREGIVMNMLDPARRQQIEQELGSDPTRSNRRIGRLVGCDHKTVASVRSAIGANSQNGEMGISPKPSGEIDKKENGKLDWGDVPDDA
jgi:hypothetical protein